MEGKYEEALNILKKYDQEHILKNFENLSQEKKERLLNQILSIDFEQIKNLYESTKKEISFANDKIEPIGYVDKSALSEEELKRYNELGENAIKQGKYSVVTMAGGQGTRLGHNGPKGTFMLGLENDKSIFEILADSLKASKEKYGVTIPWYIMTSRENNEQTENFFKDNNYFGYDSNAIKFFKQGELPMCSEEGKLLIDESGVIKEAADGHGGIFESMRKNGVISDMKAHGIEWAFIGPVDNVLVKMVDPTLLGVALDKNVLAAGKSVVKAGPKEKVGVFCKRNGKPGVVEYTEITTELSEATNENGELVFGESHINCNLFNVKAIDEVSQKKLPYHSAHKKAKYINENGELIVPEKPNAFKFESFIFDAFDMLDDMAILRVKREEEFAPVKNAEGNDCPETARKLYKDFFGIN
ncbi:MAG: UTP--glucose-1-phosphate uridylyltransferase [Clostridia bacterium]|nr:UTP--glucose-1-phosphate uridylyltransferase [Clostridia bacterium]